MKKYTTLLVAILASLSIYAQQHARITGNVITADGLPAENVSVALRGTTYGTSTDAKGFFTFHAPTGDYTLIIFSIIHHKVETPITIKANEENNFPNIRIIETEQQLQEVVVTATRTEKRLSQAPILTTVISRREIEKSGAVSTIEALQDNVPGLVITPNAMGNNLRIKGLNTRYVLILVDGERLVSEGAGGNINFDQIDVNDIKRIEMVNGAASALYGSNAVGAVINIITKDPVHKFEGGANVIAESYNTWRTKVNAGFRQGITRTRMSAFRNSSDGFGGDGSGAYAARYEDYGGSLKLGVKPTDRLDIDLTGRYFRHETFNRAGTMNVVHPLTHTLTVGGSVGYTSADKRNRIKLSTNYDKYLDMIVLERRNNEAKKKNSASYLSNRLLNTFTPNDTWEFVGGLEQNREVTFATTTLGSEPATKRIDDINVFGQAEYKPGKNFDIVAGVRYTYNNQFKSAFTPKLSVMYTLGDFKFRAGTGTAFRAPSIKELYYNFDHQGMFWIFGNPKLKAEKGLYNSLSAEYDKGSINASVSVYHNRINQKITQYAVIADNGGRELHYTNVSSSTIRGVDANLSWTVIKPLLLKANYSYTDARNDETGLQIQGNIKHSVTTSATWNGKVFDTPFSLQLAGRLNSPQIYQERKKNGELETKQSKSFSVWKVTLVKPFRIGSHLVELTAKADNVFGFQDRSFVNPGRQYLVGLKYAFR